MRFIQTIPLLLLVCLVACGKETPAVETPSAPTPVPQPAPAVPSNMHRVFGYIRTPEGQPVAGVTVSVGSTKYPTLLAETDAQGRYEGQLPAGVFDVILSKRGYEGIVSAIRINVPEQSQVDYTFPLQVTLFGSITELGVGGLNDVKVEIASGPNAGRSAMTSGMTPGRYTIPHLDPGDITVRASKAGYETVERQISLTTLTTVDFTMKWAYGSCLTGVTPVLFDHYRSSGGREAVVVSANAGRTWSAVPDSPWIEVLSSRYQTGTAELAIRVQEYPAGGGAAMRRGAVQVRCGAGEGQNIWINQVPNCKIQITPFDTPASFPASGGIGHLNIHPSAGTCGWEFRSLTPWLNTAGVNRSSGDLSVAFGVQPNTTGVKDRHARGE